MALWSFHPSVPSERREALLAWASFENIIGALMFEAKIRAFIWEWFNSSELRGCRRAEFLLSVPSHMYDAFFNSPVGYRAQYATSPELGRKANRELIRALRSRLDAYVRARNDAHVILSSIDASGAKVWIDENEVGAHYIDESPEIDFPPWASDANITAGLRAPIGNRLVLVGGWLDRTGVEVLNPGKSRRSEEIHNSGFS
jgi:hypothetical protein